MIAMEGVSYLLFCVYLFSFFGLTAWAAKLAGRPVWLFGKGIEPQALPAWLFRIAFAGSAIWPLVRALIGDPVAFDPIRDALDGTLGDIAGHTLIAIGACIAAASQMHMGASWRIGAAEGEIGKIVDDGPFAVSRNPVFVGQVMLFAGLFLVFPGIIQALLTIALVVAVQLQVTIEERVLTATLGEPYVAYCGRVARWLGYTRTSGKPL
jgi:protein-S-isoprenylcysteine O-methyltransferase Ste14